MNALIDIEHGARQKQLKMLFIMMTIEIAIIIVLGAVIHFGYGGTHTVCPPTPEEVHYVQFDEQIVTGDTLMSAMAYAQKNNDDVIFLLLDNENNIGEQVLTLKEAKNKNSSCYMAPTTKYVVDYRQDSNIGTEYLRISLYDAN